MNRLEVKSSQLSLGIRQDIWSCAVILYKLLTRAYTSDLEFEPWAQFKSTSSPQASPPPFNSTVSDLGCDLFDAMFLVRNRNIKCCTVSFFVKKNSHFILSQSHLRLPSFSNMLSSTLFHISRLNRRRLFILVN